MNRWDGKKVKDWRKYINHRCLVVEDSWLGNGCEVTVLEVSPSEKWIKFKYLSGAESWKDVSKYLLIECLEATDD